MNEMLLSFFSSIVTELRDVPGRTQRYDHSPPIIGGADQLVGVNLGHIWIVHNPGLLVGHVLSYPADDPRPHLSFRWRLHQHAITRMRGGLVCSTRTYPTVADE